MNIKNGLPLELTELIWRPCYSYSREAREAYFNNKGCCFVFKDLLNDVREALICNNSNTINKEIYRKIITEFEMNAADYIM